MNDIQPAIRQQVDEIFERLEEFKTQILEHPYDHDQRGFFTVMVQLQEYLASVTNEQVIDLFFHSQRYAENEKFFCDYNDYFMRAIETVQAIDIMTDNVGAKNSLGDVISEEYLARRYSVASRKLQLLDFSVAQNFVMVGCGPFPDTCLYVHEHTGVPHIIGIDRNEEAIQICSSLISNLGFKRIHTRRIDALDYDYADADIVYISGSVRPKHDILARIADTSKKSNIQILVNTTFGLKKMLFEDVNQGNIHLRLRITEQDRLHDEYWRFEMLKIDKYDI